MYDELFESILTGIHMAEEAEIKMNSVIINGRKYGKMFKNCPPNMKPTIFGMSVKPDYTMPDEYDYLIQWDPPKPQTNGDRIRQMSDEELLDEFIRIYNELPRYSDSWSWLKEWLKQEDET